MKKYLDIDKKVYVENDRMFFSDKPEETVDLGKSMPLRLLSILLESEPKPVKIGELKNRLCIDDYDTDALKQAVSNLRRFFKEHGILCNASDESDPAKISIENERKQTMSDGSYRIVLPHKEKEIEHFLADLFMKRYALVSAEKDPYDRNGISLCTVYQRPLILKAGKECDWSMEMGISENMRMLVEAPNGYGKTTFLRSLLLSSHYKSYELSEKEKIRYDEIARFHGVDGEYLALYLECTKFETGSQEDPHDSRKCKWIYETMKNETDMVSQDMCDIDAFLGTLEEYASKKRLLVLLDGFDEVNEEKREQITERIRLFFESSTLSSGTRVIMTTRPAFWSEEGRRLKGFTKYRISNKNILEDKNVFKEYVKKYALLYSGIEAEKLYRMVNENVYLNNLICTPAMIVWLMCEYSRYGEQLKLYLLVEEIMSKMMLRYYSREYKRSNLEYRRVYEEIAYEFLVNSKDNETGFCDLDWNNIIKAGVGTAKAEGLHAFDNIGEDSLGELFFTNLSLVEWETDRHFRFLSPVFAYHLAALHLLRLLADPVTAAKNLKEDMDRLPVQNRYCCLTVASSIAKELSDTRFYSGFPKNKTVRHDSGPLLFDYIAERLSNADETESQCIRTAVSQILDNTYGENVLNDPDMIGEERYSQLCEIGNGKNRNP